MIICHAHLLLAHLGYKKTIQLLCEEVWWQTMVKDTEAYCKTCSTCAMSKPNNQQAMGLLKTLPVPHRPWQSIGIDFVRLLPETSSHNGMFNMICVVIDHLTSMIHLMPTCQTYGTRQMAEVIFDTIYKLHGLLEKIVSNRNSLFTSTFWCHLHELLGIELRLSSVYHPQMDGATEQANWTMTQMLHQCVWFDQKDWTEWLPAIEFAMNLAHSESTGFSPFFLNYAQTPCTMVCQVCFSNVYVSCSEPESQPHMDESHFNKTMYRAFKIAKRTITHRHIHNCLSHIGLCTCPMLSSYYTSCHRQGVPNHKQAHWYQT